MNQAYLQVDVDGGHPAHSTVKASAGYGPVAALIGYDQ